ncbi:MULTISPECIES: ExeA family protein [unclassified Janthinobacterium]|uniref:ExeA family protein n=1 Tax=unclassified Janthinobacterium TaxID=2610881 RepID=UPI00034C3D66|nr:MULTISPECIES: ExeA family protein [unclassified Janthinobacterium]MEC5162969.1 general secretion pathway protein A [Janthinobacterium sp. CG_S6]
MYTQFFQLKQSPFSIAPDPRYLFMSERHREALAHLLYGVGGGGGFVLLTGEIGAGKTTVCRCFMEQIPPDCKLAYIFNPKLSVEELLLSICDEFGIALAPHGAGAVSVKSYVDAINLYLLANHAQGKNNVLIIDEAQNLSAEVLEQLRLLTNLETNERKLLQIILIGQPELRAMLARPELEQLAQRVIARYHLGSLSADETASYIGHRLAVAGAMAAAPFPRGLARRIHQLSKGVPRRINLLCDRALLGAYVENRHQVTRQILRKAAAEVFAEADGAPARAAPRWPYLLAGVMAGALVTGATAWQLLPREAQRPAAVLARAAVSAPAKAPVPAAPLAGATAAPAPVAALAPTDNRAALRELAALWGAALPAGEPCQVAAKLNLRCHQSKGGLDELRLLDRPAVLSLHDSAGARYYAVLSGLGEAGATLLVDGKDYQLSLEQLAARFDGAFVTFWRAPRSWRDEVGVGDRGPDVDWLARRLAQMHALDQPPANQALDANFQRLLRGFQLDQKLKADGVAGPKTFIRLIQASGAQEPRLMRPAPVANAVAGK